MSTWQIRCGYNVIIANKYFIEPVVLFMDFKGDEGAPSTGEEKMLDIGINWYLNKKNLKMSLHYVRQSGSGDNAYTDNTTFQKGDFIGYGFVLQL